MRAGDSGTLARPEYQVVDGLKGFPEASPGVFPETTVPTGLVPLTRFSLACCGGRPWRASGRTSIGRADCSRCGAESALGKKHPMKAARWRRPWAEGIPFYDYPPEVRKMNDTTNALESLNRQVRQGLKNRGHFPKAAAAGQRTSLAWRKIVAQWKRPPGHWRAVCLHALGDGATVKHEPDPNTKFRIPPRRNRSRLRFTARFSALVSTP